LRPGEEPLTDGFFLARGEVVLDATVGRRAGAYLARYARSHGVQIADALVAAAASTAGLRLWTLNRRHYPMGDLRVPRDGARRYDVRSDPAGGQMSTTRPSWAHSSGISAACASISWLMCVRIVRRAPRSYRCVTSAG
jgi:hypothetical protein